MNAAQVVTKDLDLITDQLAVEFPKLAGRQVLIAGGAGFLGHYLVQSALHWNSRNPKDPPIGITILDNFVRGVPDWLAPLQRSSSLRLLKHDITQPLPRDLGSHQYLIHAASIASPTY